MYRSKEGQFTGNFKQKWLGLFHVHLKAWKDLEIAQRHSTQWNEWSKATQEHHQRAPKTKCGSRLGKWVWSRATSGPLLRPVKTTVWCSRVWSPTAQVEFFCFHITKWATYLISFCLSCLTLGTGKNKTVIPDRVFISIKWVDACFQPAVSAPYIRNRWF